MTDSELIDHLTGLDDWLFLFVKESNRIEGIDYVHQRELDAHDPHRKHTALK